jgi:hypothetical protein
MRDGLLKKQRNRLAACASWSVMTVRLIRAVIARSKAMKQSSSFFVVLDCFASLAMTPPLLRASSASLTLKTLRR